MKDQLLNRFLKYIAVDTQSDPNADCVPSTQSQYAFAEQLRDELSQMGVQQLNLTQHGCVMGKIPSNTSDNVPATGFIAHLDTAPGMNGRCVCPGIRSDYKGDAIVLDKKNKIILDPKIFPELLHYKGQTIIHTDGSTLLGADDKAGIAEIMTAIQFLLTHPEIKHGAICIAFTPDEEIGTGIDHFDVNAFGADYAYTVDGGGIGELEYENFNAAIADIHIEGVDIHPGEAKGKMINALHVAHRIEAMFPQDQKPEYTQDYEGFFLLTQLNGTVGQANMQYIIRDHDKQKFEDKKKYLSAVVRQMNMDYRPNMVSCKIRDQYYNMKEKIEEVPFMITIAEEAMREADVVPIIKPIRGGTDGARLSFRGLPCPNLFTGGHNFHGKYEFIPLESMEKATLTIINLIQKYARRIENF